LADRGGLLERDGPREWMRAFCENQIQEQDPGSKNEPGPPKIFLPILQPGPPVRKKQNQNHLGALRGGHPPFI